MGPFVPDIIPDQLNLVFGLLLGIAFGFVLEQAGFSSSRKLTGLFYGRDFTVLRVFFTGAITAMIGVILLGYYGLLDTDIIYINPTYLWPAIVGGLIMGVGFVVGGYCPGTSGCGGFPGRICNWTGISHRTHTTTHESAMSGAGRRGATGGPTMTTKWPIGPPFAAPTGCRSFFATRIWRSGGRSILKGRGSG